MCILAGLPSRTLCLVPQEQRIQAGLHPITLLLPPGPTSKQTCELFYPFIQFNDKIGLHTLLVLLERHLPLTTPPFQLESGTSGPYVIYF